MRVVDASVLANVLVGEPAAIEAVTSSANDESEPIHCPALVEVETLSALRGMERGRRIEPRRAERAVAALAVARLVLYSQGTLRERVWALRHNLTAYDASYLALAELLDGSLLLTSDAALAGHARRTIGDARVQLVR